jgi:hypothetical protein
MNVTLSLAKEGRALYEGAREITDATSFGNAFTEIWLKSISLGQLMDYLNDDVLG